MAAATSSALTRAGPSKGLGTSLPCVPGFRRKITYWVRPRAIPTAAAPKP